MSTKKPFTTRIDTSVRDNFQKVAAAHHMDDTVFAALWISRLSELKPEHALDALTAIPKEFFRGRPGRPPSRTSDPTTDSAAVPQNAA